MSQDFLLGADPEVQVKYADGSLLRAADYLPHNDNSPLGADGHPWVTELRPRPGNPIELTENIRSILLAGRERNQRTGMTIPEDATWHAGAWVEGTVPDARGPVGKPIGGHIHFSVPFEDRYGIMMDGVVNQFICCIEDTTQARQRRAGGNYGILFTQSERPSPHARGAIRLQPWGFEYRSLPSFIFSKGITLGVFALAKAVMKEEVDEGPLRLKKLRGDFAQMVNVDTEKHRLAERQYFLDKLDILWRYISWLQYWRSEEGKRLWKYTAGLKRLVQYESWDNGQDVLSRWHIVDRKLTVPKKKPRARVPAGHVQDRELWQTLTTGTTTFRVGW